MAVLRRCKSFRVDIDSRFCKICGICASVCPSGALEAAVGRPPLTHSDRCTGCGLCEFFCPDFALRVLEE